MIKCFLDMDGVLVNFVGGLFKLHRVPNLYEDPSNLGNWHCDEMITKYKNISKNQVFDPLEEDFWANLEPMHDFNPLLKIIEDHFGRENICLMTSPTMNKGCPAGKLRWIEKHMPWYYKNRHWNIGSLKHFSAHKNSILLDDSAENIKKFHYEGGDTILIPRPWNHAHIYANDVVDHLSNVFKVVRSN